jgi:heme-degrading monooxygenase HmoA
LAQHVTYFRMKVQPGKIDDLKRLTHDQGAEARRLADSGWEKTVIGQSKSDPNTVWGVVTWDTTERYQANANAPEQNEWYQKMRALLESDPEWFDCDVIDEQTA